MRCLFTAIKSPEYLTIAEEHTLAPVNRGQRQKKSKPPFLHNSTIQTKSNILQGLQEYSKKNQGKKQTLFTYLKVTRYRQTNKTAMEEYLRWPIMVTTATNWIQKMRLRNIFVSYRVSEGLKMYF